MITVKNDYEPIIYEQTFSSHIFENQSELLQDYYTRPIRNDVSIEQNVNEINTVVTNEKQRSSTSNIYQNIQKEPPREKIWTIPFLLESPKSTEFQPPDLEMVFLIDSGAESNIINIPTWNEIKSLHPILTPIKTASKLATAQGSTLVNYQKSNFSLFPLEQWHRIKC